MSDPATAVAALLPGLAGRGAPVDLTREQAAELARRELAKSAYHPDDGDWFTRIGRWLIEHVSALLDRAAAVSPGGYLGLAVLLVAIVGVVVLVRLRTGPLARGHRERGRVLPDVRRSAADHRAAADRAAAAGRWSEAVIERMRALARGLEERTVVDERPGRTAEELAAEVRLALPDAAPLVTAAAAVFDEVRYGGRAARPEDHDVVARADAAAASARRPRVPA